MTEPVAELIRQHLLSVVAAARTLGMDGATDAPLSVTAPAPYGDPAGDLCAVVEAGSDEWLEDGSGAPVQVGKDTYRQEYLVRVALQVPEGTVDAYDLRALHVAAAIRKAVMSDFDAGGFGPSVWLVKPHGTTVPGLHCWLRDDGSIGGPVVPFSVTYRTARNDPYTA